MTIYTGRGDEGRTDLRGAERVSKTNARIETYGTVDEVNSLLGVALPTGHDDVDDALREAQNHLHVVQADLANPEPSEDDPRITERTSRPSRSGSTTPIRNSTRSRTSSSPVGATRARHSITRAPSPGARNAAPSPSPKTRRSTRPSSSISIASRTRCSRSRASSTPAKASQRTNPRTETSCASRRLARRPAAAPTIRRRCPPATRSPRRISSLKFSLPLLRDAGRWSRQVMTAPSHGAGRRFESAPTHLRLRGPVRPSFHPFQSA